MLRSRTRPARFALTAILALLASLVLAAPAAAGAPQFGDVTIFKFHDANGNDQFDEGETPLEGACFELWVPDGTEPAYAEQCTGTDGTTIFDNVEFGDYDVVETVAPGGYEPVEPIRITVDGDETVNVPNQASPTWDVTVYKYDDLNGSGTPDEGEPALEGACFELWPPFETEPTAPAHPEQCTGAGGTTVFEDVQSGEYDLVETVPPPGYEFAPPQRITVEGDVTVDVANYPAQQPQGLLEIDKLDCAGADEPSMTVYENPDIFGGDPQAPEDVHPCAIGNATFEITGGDLEEPMVLETNTFGFVLTFLNEGEYEITEVEPNEVGPVPFTIDCSEETGCDFILIVAINPLECPCDTPSVVPAVARPTAAPLPNTADTGPGPSLAVAALVLLATGVAGMSAINVTHRRRT